MGSSTITAVLILIGKLLVTSASFCGENGVPFSLEILPNGSPVLGCAQPSCVALAEGEDDSIFEADPQGQFDGYFRDEERTSHLQANKFKANCSGSFNSASCIKKSQWVGGIQFVDEQKAPLALRCCSFEGLRFSQDVGVTTIAAGEAVTGGEVVRDGRQISFDVIANVRKVLDPNDREKIIFEVTVRRMNCLPDPPELQVPFDDDIDAEMERVLATSSNREAAPREEIIVPVKNGIKKGKHSHPTKTQPTFGAPTFDPTADDSTTRLVRPRPRFLEERPASEFSTTEAPPQITTTRPSTVPPETTPLQPAFVEPVTVQPVLEPKAPLIVTPVPPSESSTPFPHHLLFAPSHPVTPPAPVPFTLPAGLPTLPPFPAFAFPTHAPHVLPFAPQQPIGVLQQPQQQQPNPFAQPQQPNPFGPFPPFQPLPAFPSQPLQNPPPMTFGGGFGGVVPGLEEKPDVVQPILRSTAIRPHGEEPGSPPSTLAPLLQPPVPAIFGPFPGRK